MKFERTLLATLVCIVWLLAGAAVAPAQTGISGTIAGVVTDPSGAAVPGATVTIHNPVSGYQGSGTTDDSGNFSFANVPFNPYHLTVAATGFAAYAQDVEVRSGVPVNVKIALAIAGGATTVTVESGVDLVENQPHTRTLRASCSSECL